MNNLWSLTKNVIDRYNCTFHVRGNLLSTIKELETLIVGSLNQTFSNDTLSIQTTQLMVRYIGKTWSQTIFRWNDSFEYIHIIEELVNVGHLAHGCLQVECWHWGWGALQLWRQTAKQLDYPASNNGKSFWVVMMSLCRSLRAKELSRRNSRVHLRGVFVARDVYFWHTIHEVSEAFLRGCLPGLVRYLWPSLSPLE